LAEPRPHLEEAEHRQPGVLREACASAPAGADQRDRQVAEDVRNVVCRARRPVDRVLQEPGLGALVGAGVLVGAVTIGYGAMLAISAPAAYATTAAVGTTSAAVMPDFGNPKGHFDVPPAGRAVDTRHPNHVIGNGTPASCTSAAVVRDVAAGGIITFNCGPKPMTIVMTTTASVIKTRRLVVLDGGGLITLSGAGKRRILYSDTCAGTWSTDDCVDQPYPQIVVQNITFEDGYNGAHQATCTANTQTCWYGGVDAGGPSTSRAASSGRSTRGSSTTAATPTALISAGARSAP
jgi:hypothetical protein